MAKSRGTRLGAFRAYFFGFFICTAGFLFGYDTGIVGMYNRYGVFLEKLIFIFSLKCCMLILLLSFDRWRSDHGKL